MPDWSVLDRPGSPAPGDPGRVRELAGRLLRNAELAERNTGRLRGVAAGGGDLGLQGDFAPGARQALGELPDNLEKMGRAYRGCGDALNGYANGLDGAQAVAQRAWNQGSEAYSERETARRRIRSLAPPALLDLASPMVFRSPAFSEARLGQITDPGLQASVRAAVHQARVAEANRQSAKVLADQAAELHRDAQDSAVRGINDALSSSGIKNPGFWERLGRTLTDPKTWDAVLDVLEVVVAVLAVAALLFSGVGLLGLLVLVLGTALVIGRVAQAATGNGSWLDVGLALVYMLPGARAIGTFARSARFLAPLRGALGSSRFFSAVRGFMSGPGRFGRNLLSRVVGRDPIDMATGEVVMPQTDAVLASASLPLVLRRTYVSSYQAGRLFGPGWSSPLDQRLEVDPTGVYYVCTDGVLQWFPFPESDDPVHAGAGERVELRLLHDGTFTVTDPRSGVTLHFGEIADSPLGIFNLLRLVDRNGNAVEFDYAGGVLASIRHFGGHVVDVVTEGGLATALRLRGGDGQGDEELVRYGYDASGRLTRVIDPSGRPFTFSYDEHGRVTSWTDRIGAWYRYTYDSAGRCIGTQGVDGILNGTIAYDETARTTVETNSLGNATAYHFNEAFQTERIVDPLGNATVMAWDPFNHLVSRTDPVGNTTQFTYDQAGNVTEVRFPDGGRGAFSYNALNLVIMAVDPSGATWRYRYDERGNLVGISDPGRNETTITVDDRGWPTSVTNAAGQTTRFTTDAAGLLTSVTDPTGATITRAVDRHGRPVTLTDALGSSTQLGWTSGGLIASVTAADGSTQRWSYDAQGKLAEVVSRVGGVTRFETVGIDLLGGRTDPDGSRTSFGYDTEQRLVAVTNPQGLVWRYEYDAAGRPVRETDFSGRTVAYTGDAAGRIVERANAEGQVISYGYDAFGRVVESTTGGEVTAFRYDPVGRLVAAANPGVDLRREYDDLGRLTAETVNGRTIRFEYDALGRRSARVTPSGVRTRWSRDANGLPVSLRLGEREVQFVRDVLGREVQRTLGSMTLAQSWDGLSRLGAQTVTGPGGQLVRHRDYAYRADDQVTAVHDQLAGTYQYDLDVRGRVTTVHAAGGPVEQYSYDAAGNIVAAVHPSPSGAHDAIGARDYVGTLIRSAGQVRYEHDAQGRMILRQRAGQTWHYAWDAYDRLVAVTTADGTRWTYQYDPLGRRIAKTMLGPDGSVAWRVDFVWDGPRLAEQITSDGRVTTWEYEPGGARPLVQAEADQVFAVVTDLVGTPTELVDLEGAVVWHRRATLWGEPAGTESTGVDCPLRFPGQYHDAETELHYNVFRYYDPVCGRYTSVDPLGLNGGDNPHQYVRNPVTWLDPLGLFSVPGWVRSGALNSVQNMFAQAINDMRYGDGMQWQNELIAGVAGFGPGVLNYHGFHSGIGAALTSFLTNGGLQLLGSNGIVFNGGDFNGWQLGASTVVGGSLGFLGKEVAPLSDVGEDVVSSATAFLIGFFDGSGSWFPN